MNFKQTSVEKTFEAIMKELGIEKFSVEQLPTIQEKITEINGSELSKRLELKREFVDQTKSLLRKELSTILKSKLSVLYNHQQHGIELPITMKTFIAKPYPTFNHVEIQLLEMMGVLSYYRGTNHEITSINKKQMKQIWPDIHTFKVTQQTKETTRNIAGSLPAAIYHILGKPMHEATNEEIEKIQRSELDQLGIPTGRTTLSSIRKRHRNELKKPVPYAQIREIEKQLKKKWVDINHEEIIPENIKNMNKQAVSKYRALRKTEQQWKPKKKLKV